MFSKMFDELKEVKYFKKKQISKVFNVNYFKEIKRSPKTRGLFRIQESIYDGVFLRIYLTAYYFCNKNSIIDVLLGYI